jgi:hypothetical protein
MTNVLTFSLPQFQTSTCNLSTSSLYCNFNTSVFPVTIVTSPLHPSSFCVVPTVTLPLFYFSCTPVTLSLSFYTKQKSLYYRPKNIHCTCFLLLLVPTVTLSQTFSLCDGQFRTHRKVTIVTSIHCQSLSLTYIYILSSTNFTCHNCHIALLPSLNDTRYTYTVNFICHFLILYKEVHSDRGIFIFKCCRSHLSQLSLSLES